MTHQTTLTGEPWEGRGGEGVCEREEIECLLMKDRERDTVSLRERERGYNCERAEHAN